MAGKCSIKRQSTKHFHVRLKSTSQGKKISPETERTCPGDSGSEEVVLSTANCELAPTSLHPSSRYKDW